MHYKQSICLLFKTINFLRRRQETVSFICIHMLKTKKQNLTHLKTTCQIIHNTPFSLSLSFNMLLQHDLSYHKQTQDYLFFYCAVNRTTCTTYVQNAGLWDSMHFMNKHHKVSFSYYFIFDRIICVLATFWERGHFVMLIIKSLHLINLHFWTYRYQETFQINQH